MLGRALFYGAGAGKLPTASAVVADILDVLSHRSGERKLPAWKKAEESDVAPCADYVCRRVYAFEGCARCAEKAKAALGTDQAAFLEGGRFAVISAPMSEAEANAAVTASGLTPILSLPVLD
jgi:homoserine dehydrogenase